MMLLLLGIHSVVTFRPPSAWVMAYLQNNHLELEQGCNYFWGTGAHNFVINVSISLCIDLQEIIIFKFNAIPINISNDHIGMRVS